MERKLLLLGLIRMHEMHGYLINELIDAHLGTSIQLKKPTAYKLLDAMLQDGWITAREEQEGRYPTRRVYAITPEGDAAFLQLLRENLAEYKPTSYMNNIGFIYLDALPAEESLNLLKERQIQVSSYIEKLRADLDHEHGFEIMISYHLSHLWADLQWLDEAIAGFQQIRRPDHNQAQITSRE